MSGALEGAVERGPNHCPRRPLEASLDTLSGILSGWCARTSTKNSGGNFETKRAKSRKFPEKILRAFCEFVQIGRERCII